MKTSFDITINIMGDVANKKATITPSEVHSEYIIQMPGEHETAVVKFENGNIVQTKGIPLDSNTIYSISEGIKAHVDLKK
nr:hypothetical protein [Pseudopedobacter sp.]